MKKTISNLRMIDSSSCSASVSVCIYSFTAHSYDHVEPHKQYERSLLSPSLLDLSRQQFCFWETVHGLNAGSSSFRTSDMVSVFAIRGHEVDRC